jgi:Domain of unknown function (DUF4386)
MNTMNTTESPSGRVEIVTAKRTGSAVQRLAEIMIATLFLLTAAASVCGVAILDPILNAPDYLAGVFVNKKWIALGSLMWSINNIGIVFIAVFAFPMLRKLDETLAVAYLTVRIIEGAVMLFGIAATLLLIPLGQEFVKAGASGEIWFHTIGDVLKQLKLLGLTELSLPLLGLGGMIFAWQMFRFRLVPRFISGVGLIGYALVFNGGIASWFDLIDATPFGPATFLAIPVALFEILLLPFWLLFKGFQIPEETEAWHKRRSTITRFSFWSRPKSK